MAYRLRTLGGVSLTSDGRAMDGPAAQRRRLALLALIASAGDRGVSRDRLIGLLWPDSEPGKARQVLAQWLHLIRRDLGDDALFLGTADLRLNPARIASDVSEFREALERNELERAAGLYGGPFLDGFYLGGAPDFERWAEEERARLAASMRGACDSLLRGAVSRGDRQAAVLWSHRLVALDALDARAALAYMNALADAGESAQAVRHARVHAELVRSQLETEPDPEIERLAERLRAMPQARAMPELGRGGDPPDVVDALGTSGKPPAQQPSSIDAPALEPGRRWRLPAQIGSVVGIAAVIVVAATAAPGDRPGAATRSSRVMVAPFVNETGDTTLDAVGRMAADWIVRGVGETGLLEIVTGEGASPSARAAPFRERAATAGAGTLITGRFYRQGDSLAFHAQILDVPAGRVLGSVGPVLASPTSPLDGVEVLRQRTMGSVAALVDQSFAPLGAITSVPPSYEAFRALREAGAAGRRRFHAEAAAHYRRAASLDTGYLLPLVELARTYGNMFDCRRVDSIADVLRPRRERLTPYERLLVDREAQMCRGDILAAYGSAKRLLALAPSSSSATIYLARSASNLNRPREVLSLLFAGDAAVGAPRPLVAFNLITFALHSLGDYRRELEIARPGRLQYPDLLEPLAAEGRALAALGDLQGVRAVVAKCLTRGRESAPVPAESWRATDVLQTLAHELRAHGHPAESRRVGLELRAWLLRHPPPDAEKIAEEQYLLALFGAHTDLEEWDEARLVAQRLAARHGGRVVTLSARGRLAAYVGHRREAERLADSLAQLTGPYLRGQHTHARAQIAALLGQRERAVELLRDAFAEGLQYDTYRAPRTRSFNHALPEFQSLRGYPPFEELLAPQG